MKGAVRVLTTGSKGGGKELTETITVWDPTQHHMALSIDKGGPPFAKSLIMGFRVRPVTTDADNEENNKKEAFVDIIIDLDIKPPFCILAPVLKMALPKQIGELAQGIADLVEEE